MSHSRKSVHSNKAMKITERKHCNACLNAGLSAIVVSSHNPRELRNGKFIVVCPTIQNMVCQFCRKTGHSKTHCRAYQQTQTQRDQAMRTPETKKRSSSPPPAPRKQARTSNIFAVLEEDQKQEETVAQTPQTPIWVNAQRPHFLRSWADYEDSDEEDV